MIAGTHRLNEAYAEAQKRKEAAKQCDDSELDLWMSEIRLRAVARIGKISREVEKANFGQDEKGRLRGRPSSGNMEMNEEQLAAAASRRRPLTDTSNWPLPDAQFAPAAMAESRSADLKESQSEKFRRFLMSIRRRSID